MNEYALILENISKKYYIGTYGWGTLKKDFQSYIAKKKGLEDPNKPIYYKEKSEYYALKNINIKIKKGEVIGIIGPNGAGKSTLLKLISGLTKPTTGKIYLNGKVTSILEVGAGFNGELTGRENIYLNGSILGMKKEKIDTLIDDIIKFSELEKFIDTPVKRYSSGMYIRLGFSVAVHLLSDIVIIDEALAVGDVNFQTKALTKLKQIAKKDKRTILYVSHNMTTIKELCSKCIVLNKGKLIYFGPKDKAIEIYRGQRENKQISKHITNKDRSQWVTPQKITITKISFINKKQNIFKTKEEIKLHLEFKKLKPINSIYIRTIIINYNQEIVASSIYHAKNLKEEINLNYNFNQLISGNYGLVISLYDYDNLKNETIEDLVLGLNFKIENKWNNSQYGSIILPPPKIESIDIWKNKHTN